tara:strand:- start:870 stop:1445 length:576 start_codon:yes stop_codon:yes gene_type:complete
MFILKNKYFFIIENTKDIDLKNIKKSNKFNIIYRSNKIAKNFKELLRFRNVCKTKNIGFYVSNNIKLAVFLKADGIYISAYNKDLTFTRFKHSKFQIIGSAHNIKELKLKKLQGCTCIIFSRLFLTSYKNKNDFLGTVKFNLLSLLIKENLIPLGGIRLSNLNKLNIVRCSSIALLSEIKKKPKTLSRCFF